MGVGIFLLILGAILALAVRSDASVVDIQVVGLILMVATATPEARLAGSSSEISPVASTRSNGTV